MREDLLAAMEVYKARGDIRGWYECLEYLYRESPKEAYHLVVAFRNRVTSLVRQGVDPAQNMRWLKEGYRLTAQDKFDDYMIYVEWEREDEKKFWLPRRRILLPVVEAIQDLVSDQLDLLTISLPPGTGKALANNTPVMTRNGFKNHGDLVVGDEVISPNGDFVRVTAVHPKCKMQYKVTFTNGDSVYCHGNHEWTIYNRHRMKKDKLSTEEMYKSGVADNRFVGRGHRYYYQLLDKTPMAGEKHDLPLKPYTFGVWLGDGVNRNPTICGAKCDSAVIESVVKDDGYAISWKTEHKDTHVMYYGFGFRKNLQSMGLCHSRRRVPKYIPDVYLTASLEQRLELLAGLLDTDGTRSGNFYQFTTCEESLKNSFVKLIATFGWRTCVIKVAEHISTSGIHGKGHWSIKFRPHLCVPCRLERKQLTEFGLQRRIAISSIEPISEDIEGNCITVDGGEYCVGNTMLPTHNSTLKIFLLSWLCGKDPDKPNLDSGHSGMMTQSTYDGVLQILTDSEYLWGDVFPLAGRVITNAKELTIDVGKRHRFSTLTCRAIGASLTGATRCEGILSADDLVSGIEEAMSKDRLDKKWDAYNNDLKSRKKMSAKELHIATRWSVHDVIGRLERQYAGDPRAKFIVVPALDENGESNFDYGYGVGFDTKYFMDMKDSLDDASFRALFMNEPIEREGLLYHPEDLRRYFDLPEGDPDAVLAVCDTAEGGGDDTFMPIFAVYGNEHYCIDCVCSSELPEVTDGLCANALVKNKVKMCQFESNSAGGRTADKVEELMKSQGGHTRITKKRTTANKATKIIVNSPWVKENVLFLDEKKILKGSPYAKMIEKLCSYTQIGKNKHDDVPDGFAQYAIFVQNLLGSTAQVVKRPF